MLPPLHALLAAAFVGAAALALSGCASTDDHDSGSTAVALDRLVGAYELRSLAGVDLDRLLDGGAARPTMRIDADGRLSGGGGVNRYTTSLDTDALLRGAFETGPVATTRKAGPPAAMELEDAFLAAVDRARIVRLHDGMLTLLDDAGAALATFAPSG